MSGYSFRPAVREQVGLLIGLAGASGSGKTYSAMRLAAGIVGPNEKFAVIDTEARRSLHYADMFKFDICDLHPPFRPANYADAIIAADKAGYKVIVVDSMSHCWAGEGGVLDWAEEELTRMAGDDWKKREACKMASWIRPKGDHKKMVQRLLQVKATVILCFRAEEKVKMEKDDKNKTVIVPIGWQPICEKNLPFELTVSFLLTPDKPGMPQPLKLQEQHKALFPLDKPINEESGRLVAEWAKGGAPKPEPSPFITEAQRRQIVTAMGQTVAPADLLKQFKVASSKDIPADKFDEVMAWVEDMKLATHQGG
jgi:AAA domain-containing protein